jgi:uncharacterized protein
MAKSIKKHLPLTIGTAQANAGQYVYGNFEAFALPTGGVESFPIIIGRGKKAGPTLWITASIHGNEYTGIQVIHRLLSQALLADLRGTIVAVPTLNPGGLRIGARSAYYLSKQDPNRLFPAPPTAAITGDTSPPSMLEAAYSRLFAVICSSANYLIDLHNYNLNSFPFTFCDPVYYFAEAEKAQAEALYAQTNAMIDAFGHTAINEFASADYLQKNLHRSVSGACLQVARIPAFTVELGGYLVVDLAIVAAATAGLRNVLRWAGMLPGKPEPITGVARPSLGRPVRRIQHAHLETAGIVRFVVQSGQIIAAGEPVAYLSDIYGRPIAHRGKTDGAVCSDYAGIVLGVAQGNTFYPGDALITLAIADDSPMVLPYPQSQN